MITSRKIATAFRLLAGGDFRNMLVRMRYQIRLYRLQRQAGKPFFFRDAGTRLWCDPKLPDSFINYTDGPIDLLERDVLKLWLKPGHVLIDGGANIGVYSLESAHAVGAEGLVIAVEPTPALANHILTAASLLGHTQIRVAQCALSDKTGRADFAFASGDATATCQALVAEGVPGNTEEIVTVEVTTFSALADARLAGKQPAAVKLDIEGAEMQALAGTPRPWLESDGPLWIVECNTPALVRFGTTIPALIAAFPDEHFENWIIPKWPLAKGDDFPRPAASGPLPDAALYNLIAIPRGDRWNERREAVRRALKKAANHHES